MRQFVAEQLLAVRGVGLKPARREINVGAEGERDSADPLGLRPDMHPHIDEIRAERRLHLAAHRLRQRPAASRYQPDLPGLDRKCPAAAMPLHHALPPGKSRHWRSGGMR
jgi:hypothetical protein